MRTRPVLSWLSPLLLAACGGDAAPGRPCDRLGLLCSDDRSAYPLHLADPRNASADLDGDGTLDLVTAAGAAGLSIAWRGGPRDYRLFPGAVTDVKVGHLDDDNHLDIAFLTTEPAALHVLTGTGTREFKDGPTQSLAGRPQALWLGQLDSDDRLDAVVASGDDGTLTVLTDGLTRARPIVLGRNLVAVDVADLNHDDRLDLVALDQADAAFHVVLASGDDFAAPRRVATGLSPTYLQILDHDGDDNLDVLTHGKGPEIWFHQGDGSDGFAPARALLIQKEASRGFGAHRDDQGRRWLLTIDYANLAATRLDDDDRIAGRIRGGGILPLTGLTMEAGTPLAHGDWYGGSYSLAPAHIFSELWHGGTYSDAPLVFADFDLDGEPEFSALDDTSLKIYHRLPNGSWAPSVTLVLAAPALDHTIADISGDGLPDLVIVDDTPAIFAAIAADDGSFTFTPPTPVLNNSVRLATAVLPGSDAASVLVQARAPDFMGIFAHRFDGATLVPDPPESLIDGFPADLAIADLDADGGDDLVVLVRDAEQLASLVIVPATADGWGPTRSRPLTLEPGLPTSLALGDLDLDGTTDAVLLNSLHIVRLLDINADDPPAPKVDELLNSASSAAIADADADGRPDIVYCSSSGLTIVLATADDTWQAQPPFDSYHTNCTLHVDPTDLRPLALLADSGALTLLAPDLAPALVPLATFDGGPAPFSGISIGDLDADDHPDIVVTAASSAELATQSSSTAVLWGRPDGRPQRATWTEGHLYDSARQLLAPLDDRPGDELVLAFYGGSVEIWSFVDGALALRSQTTTTLYRTAAVGVQTRADGPADIIVIAAAPDGNHWNLTAIPRNKAGELGDQLVTLADPMIGPYAPALTIADFDADGYDDLVMLSGSGPHPHFIWGDRQRDPTTLDLAPIAGDAHNITHADMNNDGRPELIVGTTMGVFSYAFTDREPAAPIAHVNSSAQQGLLIADLEGDGYPDILRAADNLLNVTLRAPGGDERVQLPVPASWSQLRAVDLDGDGILDLVGLRDGNVTTRLSAPQ